VPDSKRQNIVNDEASNIAEIAPMRKSLLNSGDGYLPAKAKKVGCEAIYIPGEDDTSPGEWTFHQNYNQGKYTRVLPPSYR
jgi:hypothetical protein